MPIMTSHSPKIEVLSGPERRGRWSTAEKLSIIQETYEADATVSIVARHYGIQPNRLFTWRPRRHDGRVAVAHSNVRLCSDGFEIGCDNKEKVRVAFALDCCDREAIAHVATTEGIKSEDLQDLVIKAVENRFGRINILPKPIERLTDNGSCFIASDTKSLPLDIGMEPLTTPVRSLQSNGMAEAFVKKFKRDYVSVNSIPDAKTS